ncbi:DNA helicase [Tanacetum coccineum]
MRTKRKLLPKSDVNSLGQGNAPSGNINYVAQHGRVPELCPDNYDSEYIPIEGVRNDSESLERGQLGHLGVSPNTNISASMSPLFVDDVCNVKRRRLCRINDVGPSQPTQSQTETQNVVHSLSHSTSISTSTSLPFVDDVGNFKRRRLCSMNNAEPSQPTRSETETENNIHGYIHSPSHNVSFVSVDQCSPDAICRDQNQPVFSGIPSTYKSIGKCEYSCQYCGALFWYDERLKSIPQNVRPKYNGCCKGGRVVLRTYQIYPEYIKLLLQDRHFMENIRAYNQMFSMTSLGANIDESINIGRGPYVFKISGQLYHWIGSLCPEEGQPPRFLQLYVYDTDNEVDNRMNHFGGQNSNLRRDIVEGLIELLDTHNALVQLFRTAREKLADTDIPNFQVRLYNVVGAHEYELPTGDTLGAIVYEPGPETQMDYDIIIEERSGHPQRITEYMADFPLLTTTDRADIVDRVFEMKVQQFVRYLRDAQPFGKTVAVLYTIEFQKRGLPHCHTLLWIHDSARVHRDEDIDLYICAELPSKDTDPECYTIVSELMMHGPCGLAYPSASCTQNGVDCKKHFPKEYCSRTYTDKDGFVHYRRRDTATKRSKSNCGVRQSPAIVARISKTKTSAQESTHRPQIVVDEIKNYLDSRYVSPHEACWRMLEFDIHHREPAVQILSVHLQNMQRVVFRDKDKLDDVIVNTHLKKSTLTEWLQYNEQNTDGRHLTYLNFPNEFVWNSNGKYWSRRRQRHKSSIGRLIYVHPAAGDLFYQRMLLCHQKGCRSFPEIRKVNGIVYPTCRAACQALGLLEDDQEWENTMKEAACTATPAELRTLFAHILTFCQVTDPVSLWGRIWRSMSEDLPYTSSISLNIPNLHIDDSQLEDYVLYELEGCLNHCSRSLTDFGLRLPPEDLMAVLRNRLLMEEKSYNRELLAKEKDTLLRKLNEKQRQIFDLIINACTNNRQELIFVYGHGGTGKTFLWKTITYTLRADGKIVLAVASSGVASLLLHHIRNEKHIPDLSYL